MHPESTISFATMDAKQVADSKTSATANALDGAAADMQQDTSSVIEKNGKNSSSTSVGKTSGAAVSSKNAERPNLKALSGKSSTVKSGDTSSFHSHRFQISLNNGFFTTALRDELLFDLNNILYQLPANSFIPSFNSYGLRFGKIWFSPENEESSTWLKQKLNEINEKAVDGCKFSIEPFGLHQNKVCLNIPLILNESLSESDVLKRLHFQNPRLGICYWKMLRTKLTSADNRMIICSLDDSSYILLKKLNFRVNYGFEKVDCKPYVQKNSAKHK